MSTAVAIELPTLDFSQIELQLASGSAIVGWPWERLWKAEQEYRRFWALKKIHGPIPMPPGKDADVIWHQHILNTKQYAEDCQKFFGFFLHHRPGPVSAEACERMSLLYEEAFGIPFNVSEGQTTCESSDCA